VALSYLLFVITALIALFQLPAIQDLVLWNRHLIENGQLWRILTGNLTHTNSVHMLMNLTALWIVSFLFKPSTTSFALILGFVSLCVGTGLLFTPLGAYMGLSGSLHGIFAFYALLEALNGRKSSWLLVLGIIGKVGYEQFYGAAESTANLIAAEVAVDAHLIGCLAGFLLSLVCFFNSKR
jgi:rhomboid family GlyGly-CTERM serine protease